MDKCILCGDSELTPAHFLGEDVPLLDKVYLPSGCLDVYSCDSCGLYQTLANKDTQHDEPKDGFYHNIIEHKADINKFIQELPNGVLTLTAPNLDFILKEKCLQEFTPIHISYFTKETLIYAFEKNFFMVLGCYPINNGQDLEIRVKRPKIAIWGAGHRALTFMAWNRWIRPEYVVDSNPTKQGTKTAITGYPIVAPKTLLTEKVDMLLVSVPGKYPEQVFEQIRDMRLDMQVRRIL